MLSVSEIRVQRFKRASDVAFPLSEVNVIVGGNNSGKSSSIQGIHFFFTLLQSIELAEKWNPRLRTTIAPEELIYSPAKDPYRLYEEGYLQQSTFMEFSVTLTDGRTVTADVTKGKNANLSALVKSVSDAKDLASLTNPFSVYSPGLAGITRQESYVSDGVLLRAVSRGDANLYLRNIILRLSEDEEKWDRFTNDLIELFGTIEIDVGFEKESDEFLTIEAQFDEDRWVPLESCGTGLLQSIQILSYAHYFRPSLVILDEPDSHLHPNNQRLLCDLIVKISQDYGCRVILTTHSRHVLDALEGRSQFIWIQDGSARVATHDDRLDILMDLGALDIREVAGKKLKYFILTEDKSQETLKNTLISSGYDEADFGIFSYFGVSDPSKLKVVATFIRDMQPNSTIVIHRDRDFLSTANLKSWEEGVRAMKVQPFVTAGRDIEDSLVCADLLVEKNPNLTELDASRLIGEAAEELRVDAIKVFMNGRVEAERKSGNTNPDMGLLAQEAANAVAKSLRNSLKGKTLLSKLRDRYRAEKGRNLMTRGSSAHLRDLNLVNIRKLQK